MKNKDCYEHSERASDLQSIIRMMMLRRRWAGYVARMGEKDTYRLLVGKPEGERPLGRPRCWWVDNIKRDLGEIG
jgi:hypothetical protein